VNGVSIRRWTETGDYWVVEGSVAGTDISVDIPKMYLEGMDKAQREMFARVKLYQMARAMQNRG